MNDLGSLFCLSFSLSTIGVLILQAKPCKVLTRRMKAKRLGYNASSIPVWLTVNADALGISQSGFLCVPSSSTEDGEAWP